MSRRKWLKTTTVLGTAFPFLSSSLNAAPVNTGIKTLSSLTDREYARFVPPGLKARLFANENPFGPSDAAKKAITEALTNSYQYPFMDTEKLALEIEKREKLGERMVMLGAGSSPLLMAAAMHFSNGGGNVVAGDPSYDDLPSRFEHFKGKWKKIPLTPAYTLDLDAMEKAVDSETRLVYVCNPNNPTGTIVDSNKLRSFCERVSQKVTVFVDEAYIDYLPDPEASSMMDLARVGKNVIIARTFSKLHGFAGLRIGYIVGQTPLLEKLAPYSTGEICICGASAHAALISYQDQNFLKQALTKTQASKDFLYSTLKSEGYEYIPSTTNFVMFPIKMEGGRFVSEMMKRGVGIRDWKFNGKDWCRVSLGRMDEMQAFAAAFKEIS